MSFEFLDCMALATVPAKLLLDLLLLLQIYMYFVSLVGGFIKKRALRLFAKRWQRELVTWYIEVLSDQDSGSDLDDNLYLYFNYSSYTKKEFLESKMGER